MWMKTAHSSLVSHETLYFEIYQYRFKNWCIITYARKQTYARMHTHICASMYAHSIMHTLDHMCDNKLIQISKQPFTHMCAHMHTHMRRLRMGAPSLAYVPTHTHQPHSCTLAYAHSSTHSCTHIHTSMHTGPGIHIRECTHTCICLLTHTDASACISVRTFAFIHLCIYAQTHAHTCILINMQVMVFFFIIEYIMLVKPLDDSTELLRYI